MGSTIRGVVGASSRDIQNECQALRRKSIRPLSPEPEESTVPSLVIKTPLKTVDCGVRVSQLLRVAYLHYPPGK